MLPEPIEREIAVLVEQTRDVRHDLHRHPELGFEERRTQSVVRAWLEGLGYSPRICAGTGLVADLDASRPGPTIALRADLDALPIDERTDLPWRSVHAGCSHKCGHDGHTAILLGVATVLKRHAALIPGNVRLVFQPAEEGVRGGGARVMVAEGALEGVSEIYGLHNWPAWPKGQVRVQPGPMLAQVHSFTIVRRASDPAFAALVPYVVALIDLAEGPRMMANVLGEDARAVRIGDRVRVTFEDRGEGALLPQFTRVAA